MNIRDVTSSRCENKLANKANFSLSGELTVSFELTANNNHKLRV